MSVIELVDLVDSTGMIRERKVPRSSAISFPHLHLPIIIAVIVNPRGEILVQRRALHKKVNPGDVDHVCGGVMSGETPEEATIREALEETGISPIDIHIIEQRVNTYNRYRYLMLGRSSDPVKATDPKEVEWARFMQLDELRAKQSSGELTFVDDFFEDTQMALHVLESADILGARRKEL